MLLRDSLVLEAGAEITEQAAQGGEDYRVGRVEEGSRA